MTDPTRDTTDGKPAAPGHEHAAAPQPYGSDGMAGAYWILSDAERAKGFVRPVRYSYIHLKCGSVTTMGQKIAETYASRPDFYGQTFCCHCGGHFPVGAEGEFLWDKTHEKVGT